MGKVRDILQVKGKAIYAVSPDRTVYDALQVMVEKNLGALLVTEDDQLAGIFTERDYARKLILRGKASKDTSIREVMTEHPITVTPNDSVDQCMNLMVDNYVRHLPVVENEQLIGLVSIGDVIKHIINEQKFIIDSLEHYINDSR
jgi:CBS domain-containing protein